MNFKPGNIIAEFERHIRLAMKNWRVPGMSVALVKGNRVIYTKGFGISKLGSRKAVNSQTIFQIGSISKSFTATLVAMLVEEGKLSWKDRVKNHLPEFKLSDPKVTNDFRVEDLMSQRSGLPPHSGHLLPYLGFKREDIIKKLYCIKPVGSFRHDYGYQNNLFLVAAALIEKCSGKSWAQNLHRKILSPLGMNNTTATFKGYQCSANIATGHYYNGLGPESPLKVLPGEWPHHDWIYTIAPAGGINSNATDMTKWLLFNLGGGALKGRRLISGSQIKYLHTPKVVASPGVCGEMRSYCQGWVLSEYTPYPIVWHNGGTSGMKSIAAMIPEAGIGIVILSNLYETLLPEALSRTFFDLLFDCPRRNWSSELLEMQKAQVEALGESPAPNLPPRPLKFYTGTYYNDLYGPLTVSKSGDDLSITIGPKKVRLKLKHWGGDTFVLYWPGILTNGAGVQFYTTRTGIVDRLGIEEMNDGISGVFNRQFVWKS